MQTTSSRHVRTLILCSALAIYSLSLIAPDTGQARQEQKGPDESTVRIRTELVQIDVAVKDKQGNLIRNLTREDFEVFEDGKPQQVTHFAIGAANQPAAYLHTEPTGAVKKSVATVTPPPPAQGRHIVLAIDDYHLAAENMAAVKLALTKFIEQEVASADQLALAATSGTLGLYQQFTRDHAIIKRAINRLSLQDRTSAHLGGVPQISAYQAELIEQGDPGALQIAMEELRLRQGKTITAGGRGRRLSDPGNSDEGIVRSKARGIVTENAQYTAITLSSLESAIRGLRQLPGRKIIVLLSDGFFTGGGTHFAAFDLRRITDAATRAGVVIYAIDARGLVAKPTMGSAADPQNATITQAPEARHRVVHGEIGAKLESLYTLAKDTGGQAFFNNNDLGLGLKRVLEDTAAYYVLAYEPANLARDGRFRKIEVRIPSRPDIKIQTRAGYFAPAETPVDAAAKKNEKSAKKLAQEQQETKLNRFRTALNSLTPLRGIPFDLAAHFIHSPPASSLALITARIDATGLSFEQQGNTPRSVLEVVGVVLDERGQTVNSFSHGFELKRGAGAPQKDLNYHNVVPLAPGLYQVRLAVADGEMKQLGSAADWIEIPDLSRKSLQLSSIFLAEEGRDLADIYNALAATLQPKKPQENAGGPATNPLQPIRRFSRGANLDFLVFAYHAQLTAQGTGGLSIRTKVLAGGQTIHTSPPNDMPLSAEMAGQPVPVVARLPLASYEPGEYELRLEVTDQTAQVTATRSIAFFIE